MENIKFDSESRKRVINVLTDKVSATDAIAELNKQYSVSSKRREGSNVWLFLW